MPASGRRGGGGMVERHIQRRLPRRSSPGLPAGLHLEKRQGHFVACFARNLPDLFLGAFATQDESTRRDGAAAEHVERGFQTTLAPSPGPPPPGAAGSPSGAFRTGVEFCLPPNAAGARTPPRPGRCSRPWCRGRQRAFKSIAAAAAAQRGFAGGGGSVVSPPPRAAARPPPRRRCSPRSCGRPCPRAPAPTVDFDPSDEGELRPPARVVDALYGDLPHQCATTGVWFKTRAELDKHLDAQVVGGAKRGTGAGTTSRGWFVDAASWIRAPPGAGNPGPLLTTRRAERGGARGSGKNERACGRRGRRVPSGEPFETFWNAEEEEWHYRGAVVLTRAVGSAPAGRRWPPPCRAAAKILETILETKRSKRTKSLHRYLCRRTHLFRHPGSGNGHRPSPSRRSRSLLRQSRRRRARPRSGGARGEGRRRRRRYQFSRFTSPLRMVCAQNS